jgi:Kef-type K+ transport system membrane component KefB
VRAVVNLSKATDATVGAGAGAVKRGIVNRTIIERTQPLAVALILPLFFTYSGLNTRLGLLNTGYLWLLAGAVLVAAIVGKGVACWGAARASGISNREAMGIGSSVQRRRQRKMGR